MTIFDDDGENQIKKDKKDDELPNPFAPILDAIGGVTKSLRKIVREEVGSAMDERFESAEKDGDDDDGDAGKKDK